MKFNFNINRNKDTRFVGPDHIFGYNNNNDHFNAGDVLHYRREDKLLKGKERERAFVSTARSALCRLNLVKFKTLVDAFKFYDKVSFHYSIFYFKIKIVNHIFYNRIEMVL